MQVSESIASCENLYLIARARASVQSESTACTQKLDINRSCTSARVHKQKHLHTQNCSHMHEYSH